MFFTLGLMGIAQAAFLPGILVLYSLRIRSQGIRGAVFAFGLSLILNHFLAIALVMTYLYTPAVLHALFVLELAGLAVIRWKSPPAGEPLPYWQNFRQMLRGLHPLPTWQRLGAYGLLALSGLVFAYYVAYAIGRIGTVFSLWDAVVSWNRWAISWAYGQVPHDTWHYPQLLPTMLATIYVFQNNVDIQFFAKAACLLFPLATLGLLIDWGLREKKFSLLFSIILVGYLIKQCTNGGFYGGYADAPVAFMAFAGFYAVICAKAERYWRRVQLYLILGTILGAGAGILKQGGLYVLAFLPLLAWFFVLSQRPEPPAQKWRLVATLYGIAILLILPWYAYVQWEIAHGLNSSEISFVTHGIYKGLTPGQRLVNAIAAFRDKLHWAAWLIAFGTLLCLRKAPYRWLALLIAIPFFLIWGCFYSYDMRNLTVATPFIGLAATLGLAQFFTINVENPAPVTGDATGKSAPVSRRMLTGGLLLVLAGLNFPFSFQSLAALQLARQRTIGEPQVNRMVYDYAAAHHGLDGRILTDYMILPWLPHMAAYYDAQRFDDFQGLQHALLSHADAYLLLENTGNASAATLSYIENSIKAKRMQVIARVGPHLFIKIEKN